MNEKKRGGFVFRVELSLNDVRNVCVSSTILKSVKNKLPNSANITAVTPAPISSDLIPGRSRADCRPSWQTLQLLRNVSLNLKPR